MRRGTRGRRLFSQFASVAALALLAANCSSSPSNSNTATLGELFGVAPSNAPVATNTPADPGLSHCPVVEQRQGAGTLSVNTSARDPSAMQLRYQVSIAQSARECAKVDNNLVMRVGVQGRVVQGPAGGAGTINVPMRFAIVEEGMQPKPVWSKLVQIPVTIGENQPHVSFTHVEEQISVPLPPAAALERYVVYIGFDPDGAAQEKKQPARKRNPRQS